jgi:hypothetical protein
MQQDDLLSFHATWNHEEIGVDSWPSTIEEAVDMMYGEMFEDDKKFLMALEIEDIIGLHHTLGKVIRNRCGMWNGNAALLESCGNDHPDDASHVIAVRLWEKCVGEGKLRL